MSTIRAFQANEQAARRMQTYIDKNLIIYYNEMYANRYTYSLVFFSTLRLRILLRLKLCTMNGMRIDGLDFVSSF